MSTASQSITLIRALGGEVYATMITCTSGDLFQRYDADGVYPDWEADATKCPVLTYHLASSMASSSGNGEVVPDNILLYYDNQLVSFPAGSNPQNTASGGIPAGMFQILGGGTQPYQVKILKNICSKGLTSQAGHLIKIIGIVGVNRYPATIGADVQMRTANGEEVHIIGEGDNPFVVNQDTGQTTRLIAQVLSNGEPVSPGTRTFQWQKQVTTGDDADTPGWQTVSAAAINNDSLTVNPNDVDAYTVYRVISRNGSETCMDTQSVMDVGDPFYLGISVTDGTATADPLFPVGAQATEKRVFTAALIPRKTGATVPAFSCVWQITKPDGVVINANYGTSGQDSYGVIDARQNSKNITIPCGWMAENSLEVIQVTALATFTV